MKTKQNMMVKIGTYLLQAQHGSELVILNELLECGNEYRKAAGLRPYDRVRDVLRDQEMAEYCMVVEHYLREEVLQGNYIVSPKKTEKIVAHSKVVGPPTQLKLDKKGQAKLPIKDMISINIRRGRYGGTWAHVDIAIRFAMKLHPEFAHLVVRTFKDNQLLRRRDDGGEAYKDLMETVHNHLKPERYDYADIAIELKKAVFYEQIVFPKGDNIWNSESATPEKQDLRKEICKNMTTMIKIGVLNSVSSLLSALRKLKYQYRKDNFK